MLLSFEYENLTSVGGLPVFKIVFKYLALASGVLALNSSLVF